MTHSPLTNGIQLTSDSDSRNGRAVDRFIVHHAATTSLAAILELFAPGGREVSANYAMGTDGTLVLAVDEDRRAWTSASADWDGRAVTIEVADAEVGGSWPVSDASFDKLARLIADVASRYGFPITDDTVLTHQELYTRYGVSYATACPGDLQRRKGELLALASRYLSHGADPVPPTRTDDDEMLSKEATDWLNQRIAQSEQRNRRETRARVYQRVELADKPIWIVGPHFEPRPLAPDTPTRHDKDILKGDSLLVDAGDFDQPQAISEAAWKLLMEEHGRHLDAIASAVAAKLGK